MKVEVVLLRLCVASSGLLLIPMAARAQDAPQPQPAPGLTVPQNRRPTTPSAQPQPASPAQSAAAQQQKIIPAAAERHFRQGVQFERDGDPDNATDEYNAAIAAYHDYFEAHYNLGRLYLDHKGYAEAIKQLQVAVQLRPDDANAHNNLGLALKHNGDLDGAIAQYQDAVRLNPKMASAQNNLANVLYAKHDLSGAIQHYRAAIALEPTGGKQPSPQQKLVSAETHMNLGSALDDAGYHDEAISEYRQAIELAPNNASAHYNLAIVYLKKKDNANAIDQLHKAAKAAPDWPTPHIMLTNLLKDSDPRAALNECMVADGLTQDAKLHDLCGELQKRAQ